MIRKSLAVLPGTTKVIDPDQGIVEAFVNTTGVVDLQKDIMEYGCWVDVIKAADAGDIDRPSTVWGHDWAETTGKVLTAQELPAGHPEIPEKLRKAHPEAGTTKIRVAYNLDTQRGREAFSDVKFGAIKQWSVGFIPAEDGVRYDSKGIRHISKVAEWPEVSNVLVGASPGTFTATVKVAELEAGEDRPARTADRMARARAILSEVKSKVETQRQREGAKYSLRDAEGEVKFPINDCGDVGDAWKLRGSSSISKDRVERYVRRVASKLNCSGPWDDDSGKGEMAPDFEVKDGKHYEWCDEENCVLPWTEKDGRIPDLQGDEAAHMEPLRTALVAIERLIAQEVAEDEPEFDCVIRLACIGMDLVSWANSEATEYGGYADGPMPMAALMAAGIEALKKESEPTPPMDLTNPFLAGLQVGIEQALAEARSETPSPPPQTPVPAHSGESDGLTHWARSRARRRFGG